MKDVLIFDLQKHRDKVNVPSQLDLRRQAHKYQIFPLRAVRQNGRRQLLLAMANPSDLDAIREVEFLAGMPVIPVLASLEDLTWLVHEHFYRRSLQKKIPQKITRGHMMVSNRSRYEAINFKTNTQSTPKASQKKKVPPFKYV